MFFKQYSAKESTLSYFFGCGTLGKAVAVDVVAGDEQWFIDQAKEAKVTITHVIDTHACRSLPGGASSAQLVARTIA
jgi:glyoxylase-like metal-dependent hydrolase (beta-lactamase superfamily II)